MIVPQVESLVISGFVDHYSVNESDIELYLKVDELSEDELYFLKLKLKKLKEADGISYRFLCHFLSDWNKRETSNK